MRCWWCHNPETWEKEPTLQRLEDKCICCGHCIPECPHGAISVKNDRISIDRSICDGCRLCAESCVSGSLSMIGETVTPEQLLERVLRDKTCFDNSGGGVTLSGGEPTLQRDFCLEFLKLSKAAGLHTAIETNLTCPSHAIDELSPWIDLWMCDLKIADNDRHIKYTGISNSKTIQNIRHLSDKGVAFVVRTPVIPGVNDSEEDIRGICEILQGLKLKYYELLPYHSMGSYKFGTIGIPDPLPVTKDITKDYLGKYDSIIKEYNINTK